MHVKQWLNPQLYFWPYECV